MCAEKKKEWMRYLTYYMGLNSLTVPPLFARCLSHPIAGRDGITAVNDTRRRERNPLCSRVSVATVNRRPEILSATTVVSQAGGSPLLRSARGYIGVSRSLPSVRLSHLSLSSRTLKFSYRPRLISNGSLVKRFTSYRTCRYSLQKDIFVGSASAAIRLQISQRTSSFSRIETTAISVMERNPRRRRHPRTVSKLSRAKDCLLRSFRGWPEVLKILFN